MIFDTLKSVKQKIVNVILRRHYKFQSDSAISSPIKLTLETFEHIYLSCFRKVIFDFAEYKYTHNFNFSHPKLPSYECVHRVYRAVSLSLVSTRTSVSYSISKPSKSSQNKHFKHVWSDHSKGSYIVLIIINMQDIALTVI